MKPHHHISRFFPAVFLVFASTLFAQDVSTVIGKFSGTWKENEAKSKFGSNDSLRFHRNAKGELEELRGPEARPVVQPVIFDGKTHSIDAGIMIEWKQIDDHHFERKLYGRKSSANQERVLRTRKLQISPDWKTLKEETEQMRPDGKMLLITSTYTRTSSEAEGLAGTWKLTTFHSDPPTVLKLEPAGNDALKVSDDRSLTYTLTFGGKDAPLIGPAALSKITLAGKQVDNHTIEVRESREGVPFGKSTWDLSPDGKTMTVTETMVGPNSSPEPTIEVYERE